jgi:hypothetical protein
MVYLARLRFRWGMMGPSDGSWVATMSRGKLIDALIELRGPQPFDRFPGRPRFQHLGRTLREGGPAPKAGPMIQAGTFRRAYCGYILRA